MYICLNPGAIGVQADLHRTVDLARRHGFQGADFSIEEIADLVDSQGPAAVNAIFGAAGVRPGAWALPFNFRIDEAAWRAGLDALPRLARTARELNLARCYSYIIPGDDQRTFGQNFIFHVQRLRPAAQILADHGIAFGLEWVGTREFRARYRYSFVHTMDGVMALNAAIGTPNMGLLVDIFHVENARVNLWDLQRLSPQDVVYVHVNDAASGAAVDERKDNVRDLPGYTGELKLRDFLRTLKAIGYDGPITAEPFSQRLRDMTDEDAVEETGAAMRAMWQAAELDS